MSEEAATTNLLPSPQTMQLLREMERRGQTSGERLEALGLGSHRGPETSGGACGGKEEEEGEESDSDDDVSVLKQ